MSRTPTSFFLKDYHKSFSQRNPDIAITPKEYYKILEAGGEAITEILLEDGTFKLPHRLGVLMIRKFMPKGRGSSFTVPVDKFESAKQQKPVYQFNDHTGGYIFRIIWSKKKCKSLTDKNMWVFKPIRSLKRKLAALIKSKSVDYPIGLDIKT